MKANITSGLLSILCLVALLMLGCGSTIPTKPEAKAPQKAENKADQPVQVAENKTEPKQNQPEPRNDEAMLKEHAEKKAKEQAQHDSYINHLIKTAKDKIAVNEYNSAKLFLDRALELNPAHVEAHQLRNQVGMTIGESEATTKVQMSNVEEEERVKIEQAKLEANNHYKTGLDHFKKKEYETAIRSFEACLEIIKWAPYHLNLQGLRKQSEAKIKESKREHEKWLAQVREQKMKEAQKEAERLEAEEQAKKQTEIRILLSRATEYFTKKNFNNSETLVGQVLKLDPTNKVAKKLQEDINDARHSHIANTTLDKKIDAWKDFMDVMKETVVPYSSDLMFPDSEKWQQITAIRKKSNQLGQGEGSKKEISPIEREIMSKLESLPITLNFNDTPFQDVIRYIQSTADINIVVHPDVIKRFQLDNTKVTLNVTDLKLKTALNILLQFYNLVFVFKNDVLFIADKNSDEVKGKSLPVLHDIRDLTGQIKDFPGPRIRLDEPKAEGNNAGAVFTDQKDQGGAVLTGEKLTELIKSSIAPETWDKDENSIAETSGQLLVVNTDQVQEEIRKFLTDMRRFSGMMVAIEARFLDITDDFLEQLGIDWRGSGNEDLFANDPDDEADDQRTVLPALTREAEDNAGQPGVNPDNIITALANNGVAQGIQSDRPASGFFFKEGGKDIRLRTQNVDEQALGTRLQNTGGLALQFAFLDDIKLNAVLRAVKKTGRQELMQAPRLTTFNTQRANLTVVEQRSYIRDFDVEVAQSAYIADPIVGTVQFGVVLDVRPTISNDRKYITLELRPTLANLVGDEFEVIPTTLGGGGRQVNIQVPVLEIQSVETTVRLPDEGTVVLGGFKSIKQQDQKQDIPILGDIPVISFFFSQRRKADEKRQVLILVKGKIIDLEEREEKVMGVRK